MNANHILVPRVVGEKKPEKHAEYFARCKGKVSIDWLIYSKDRDKWVDYVNREYDVLVWYEEIPQSLEEIRREAEERGFNAARETVELGTKEIGGKQWKFADTTYKTFEEWNNKQKDK